MEARYLQRLIFTVAQDKKTTAIALSSLARAWTCLQESIRTMRGIPLPGQLRPDLDPAMSAKRGKRGKRGKAMLEIAMMPAETPDAKVATTTTPTTEARADETTKPADPEQVTTPKESL